MLDVEVIRNTINEFLFDAADTLAGFVDKICDELEAHQDAVLAAMTERKI